MPKKKDPVESNGSVQHAAPEVQGAAAGPPPPEAPGGNGYGNGAEAKRPPAHTVRLGRCKVTVWVNYSKAEGKPYYAYVPSRVYRTGDGDWAQASSLDRGDVLPMVEALRLAFLWTAANPLTNGDEDVPF